MLKLNRPFTVHFLVSALAVGVQTIVPGLWPPLLSIIFGHCAIGPARCASGDPRESWQWLPASQHCPDSHCWACRWGKHGTRERRTMAFSPLLWTPVRECWGPRSFHDRENWNPASALAQVHQGGSVAICFLQLLLSMGVPTARKTIKSNLSCPGKAKLTL